MLTREQRRWIAAVLTNDEASTDAELVAYFVTNGLSQMDAEYWVAKRTAYLRGTL